MRLSACTKGGRCGIEYWPSNYLNEMKLYSTLMYFRYTYIGNVGYVIKFDLDII